MYIWEKKNLNHLSFDLRKREKEQIKSKVSKIKEIRSMTAKIKEVENGKSTKKMAETKK